mmetsp:Transcript_21633/g.30313  ORF Transcript_21633/g.30313 Transcript_21633/m.30313 type:complete len:878 (+) Transcript_21633:104-2737(+)
MTDLTATLLGCQNPDPNVRNQAEQALQQAEVSNYPEFTLALAKELGTEGNDLTVRQLAGIHFKNLLVAIDISRQEEKHDKWKKMDPSARSAVKGVLINTVSSSETVARHTAAQACAEIAAVELPYNEWPEFLNVLMNNVTSKETHDGIKIASLECLGFTCERLGLLENDAPDIAPETTDRILTTIVDGIRVDRADAIRFAAATALRNSLAFSRKNMENPNERNMIMQTICEATRSQDERVRCAAYECIAIVAYQYYDKLQEYMQTLFQLTFATIKNDKEEVALKALEFWNTICDEETELLYEAQECAERGIEVEPDRVCVKYVAAALDHLVPLLTEAMTKQDEDADLDDVPWNLSTASATCLGLIARTVEDDVVKVVMPFVHQNIKNENWRMREAAIMAFASILDGPSLESIGQFVNQSIPVLLDALSDPYALVKDSTAWTIARICDLHVRSIPEEAFPNLVNKLMGKLMTEVPRVSSQVCFALHNLAAAFSDDPSAEERGTNALTPYMQMLLQTLFQVIERKDAHENNLRFSACEAISVLVANSAPDCKPLLLQLLPAIIDRLKATFNMSVITNDDKEQKEGVQGLFCGLIQSTVVKLTAQEVYPFADEIMKTLLHVLQSKNATSHEEAFTATSAISDKMEEDFEKYMSALAPFLLMGLQNFEAYNVCNTAVGLVGDISRNIGNKIQPYCNGIMTALIKSLQNPSLHRCVKPPVLSCFGDIALAIGAGFEPYLDVCLEMLFQASQTTVPDDDEELIEYVNQLREGILEAYTGIVQGIEGDNCKQKFMGSLAKIMTFLEALSKDENRDHEVLSKASGLVGDIASTMKSNAVPYLSKPFVESILNETVSAGDESDLALCNWAKNEIKSAMTGTPVTTI